MERVFILSVVGFDALISTYSLLCHFTSFEMRHHYWDLLVFFPCPVHIVVLNLTSAICSPNPRTVRSQVFYQTGVCFQE